MSKVRSNSPIEDVDKIAAEVGLELVRDGDARTFYASIWGRGYRIEEASAGKVGIFSVAATIEGEPEYSGTLTHNRVRQLFRRAVQRGGAYVAP